MNIFRRIFPQKDPQELMKEHRIPNEIGWKIELNEKGLVATSDQLPGLVTNAKDPEELLEMINDAVLEYFDVSKIESDYVFDRLNVHGQGTVLLKRAAEKKQYA